MTICIITGMYPTPQYPYAGVFVTRRISALKALGEDVESFALVPKESPLLRRLRTILGRRANEEVNDVILSDDPSVTYKAVKVPMNLFELALNRLLKEKYFIRKASRALTLATGNKKYDLVHAHWLFPTAAAALRYARSAGTPCIVSSHGSEINRDMRGAFRKECLDTLENADCAEFVSCALRDTAISFGYSGRNAHFMPNGVKLPELKTRPARENRTVKRVGFVGNLLPVKRADQFPEIFSRIREEYGQELEFVVIGEGPLMKSLKSRMSALPELNVTFTGRLSQSKVMEQMSQMDVLLLPSRSEGWVCVALEAESCGAIPVGSNNGGIPEAIGYEELCVADTPSFIDDYARKVADVLSGRIAISRDELVSRASNYSWEKLQKQEIDLYRKVVLANKDGHGSRSRATEARRQQ